MLIGGLFSIRCLFLSFSSFRYRGICNFSTSRVVSFLFHSRQVQVVEAATIPPHRNAAVMDHIEEGEPRRQAQCHTTL